MQDCDIDEFGHQIAMLVTQLLELRPRLAIALAYAHPGEELNQKTDAYADLIIDVAAGDKLVHQCLEAISADDPATRLPQFCRELVEYEDTALSVEEKLNQFMGRLMIARDKLRDFAQQIHVAVDLQAGRFLKNNDVQLADWLEEQLLEYRQQSGPFDQADSIVSEDQLRSKVYAYHERVHDQDQLVGYLLETESKLVNLQDAITEITENSTSVPELQDLLNELRHTLNSPARKNLGRH